MRTNSILSRRSFLKSLAAASAGSLLWRCGDVFGKPVGAEVIVVGAGMAGLTAVQDLHAKGFSVTVLEGRNRLGGRIWSNRDLGVAVDMGASWIHGHKRNPLTTLAKELGVKTQVTDYDDAAIFDHDGREFGEEEIEALDETFEDLQEELEDYADGLDQDVSYGAAIRKLLKSRKLSEQEQRFIQSQMAGIETESGADIDELSLLHSDEEEGFNGEDLIFPGGYDQLFQGIPKTIPVLLEYTVRTVDASSKRIRVETDKKTFEADAVLVTVPLGVLKADLIRFVPALPAAKQKAIDRLGMGVLNKVALRFPAGVKWPVDTHFVGYVAKTKDDFSEFLNLGMYGNGPVLVCLCGGPFARALEKWKSEPKRCEQCHGTPGQVADRTEGEIQKHILQILRLIYGKSFPDPVKCVMSRWHSDPFAGGSYPHVRVGGTYDDFDALAAPVNDRLFFAGDGTTRDYLSTVHGAFISGRREAKRIARLFT